MDYATVVHGLKGSSCGIVARETGDAAEAFDLAAKAGNLAAVKSGHSALEMFTETLLSAIGKAIGEIGGVADKPAATRPAPALLAELRDACAAFDMDSVDKTMDALEAFRYESGGKIVA